MSRVMQVDKKQALREKRVNSPRLEAQSSYACIIFVGVLLFKREIN